MSKKQSEILQIVSSLPETDKIMCELKRSITTFPIEIPTFLYLIQFTDLAEIGDNMLVIMDGVTGLQLNHDGKNHSEFCQCY